MFLDGSLPAEFGILEISLSLDGSLLAVFGILETSLSLNSSLLAEFGILEISLSLEFTGCGPTGAFSTGESGSYEGEFGIYVTGHTGTLGELMGSHTKVAIYPTQSAAKDCDQCLLQYQVQGHQGSELPG